MGQIEELIRKLLGNLGGVVGDPVSSVTRDLSEGAYLGDPRSRTGVQTRPAQKSSKMSQEAMDAYKELRYDLEAASKRNMPRKSREGAEIASVKQATPGLTVDAFAPVSSDNLGLLPSITGLSKEQRNWAEDDKDIWKLLQRGLRR